MADEQNLVQLLLDRGAFCETTALELLIQCVHAFPAEAKRLRIKLSGTEADNEVVDRIVRVELSELLEPLAIKVPVHLPSFEHFTP